MPLPEPVERSSLKWLYKEPPTPRMLSAEALAKLKSDLEDSIQRTDKGFASNTTEDHMEAVRQMTPTKADIDAMFPTISLQIWPLIDDYWIRDLEENLGEVAASFTKGGSITKIKARDIRRQPEKYDNETYRDLFCLIPDDVEVSEVSVHRGGFIEGGITFVHANNRWFVIKDVYSIPRMLVKKK